MAQSNASRIIADIPFAFTVGNRTFPGRYTVTRLNEKIVWIFNSQNQGTAALNYQIEGKAPDSSKMVFRRYGNAYFLSEVWVADSRTNRFGRA